MWFLENAWLIWAFPAASFAIILLFGKKLPGKGWEIGVPAVALSFVYAIAAAAQWVHSSPVGEGPGGVDTEKIRPFVQHDLFTWFKIGNTDVKFGTHIDGLAVMLMFVVGFISLMVHVFSMEYMRDDRRKTHYFA